MCTEVCITMKSHYGEGGEVTRVEVVDSPEQCRISTQLLAEGGPWIRGDGLILRLGSEQIGYRITGIAPDLQWVEVEKL